MLGILDSVIIVISLALVVGAVLRAAGKKQTDAEYFLAGRDLRWPFIGMSLLASNISAEHVVGLAGDGYRVGMVTGGFEWMAAWCLIILASLFTPLYLRSRIYTIPEFRGRKLYQSLLAHILMQRFGDGADRAYIDVNERNQPSLQAIRRVGFRPVARRRSWRFLKWRRIVMRYY